MSGGSLSDHNTVLSHLGPNPLWLLLDHCVLSGPLCPVSCCYVHIVLLRPGVMMTAHLMRSPSFWTTVSCLDHCVPFQAVINPYRNDAAKGDDDRAPLAKPRLPISVINYINAFYFGHIQNPSSIHITHTNRNWKYSVLTNS